MKNKQEINRNEANDIVDVKQVSKVEALRKNYNPATTHLEKVKSNAKNEFES